MSDDPYEKILKYIEEQKKMPHVATNIALKELTWPPKSKKAAAPPRDISDTFPSAADRERKASEEDVEAAAAAAIADELEAAEAAEGAEPSSDDSTGDEAEAAGDKPASEDAETADQAEETKD